MWEFALHCYDFNKSKAVGAIVLSEIVYILQYEEEGERGRERCMWQRESERDGDRDRDTEREWLQSINGIF